MSTSLDLNLLPIARYAGQEYPELLGLHVAEPPRRSARGRGSERLILYFAMVGNAPLAPGKRDQALADLAKLYFRTSGSATTAMRAIAEALNKVLLRRNQRLTTSSRQGIGLLTQVVLRGDRIYLAQSGPVQAYLISMDECQHFYDPEMVDRGLGQSRVAPISFCQARLQSNDTLLLAAQPSQDWNVNKLAGVYGQGPESMRRRLFSHEDLELNAVLIQARQGKGKFFIPRAVASQVATPAAIEEEPGGEPARQAPESPVAVQAPPWDKIGEKGIRDSETRPIVTAEAPLPVKDEEVKVIESQQVITSGHQGASNVEPVPPIKPPQREAGLAPIWKILVAIGTPIARILVNLTKGLRKLLGRILPGEEFLSIPSPVMALIAVAVPVIIVAIASTIYFRLGRSARYDLLYYQAEQMALQASDQADLSAKRSGLQATLDLLDQTEGYQITSESQALRIQVRNSLDDLDLIKRVDYQPAIVGGLPPTASVTKLALSDTDLYLLDGNSGSVIRAQLTTQGYEIDQAFQCGPEGLDRGPLVDIAAWPAGYKPEASVLALDGRGNALYCRPNDAPTADILASPDPENWGDMAAFTLDLGDTYLLDYLSDGVWAYWRSNFVEEPSLVFDEEIPPLQDAVDLAVNRDDLYLLHADGNLTLCFLSGFGGVPTRCSDPNYVDFRPGRENLPLIPANPFTQLMITPPPDPSLFTLEPESQAINHFSLRNLAFQRQYLTRNPLSSRDATAFYVDNVHNVLFLAIGNEVYYAPMP